MASHGRGPGPLWLYPAAGRTTTERRPCISVSTDSSRRPRNAKRRNSLNGDRAGTAYRQADSGVMSVVMAIPRQSRWLLWKHPERFRVELHGGKIIPEICRSFRRHVFAIHKVVLKPGAAIRKALPRFDKLSGEIKPSPIYPE